MSKSSDSPDKIYKIDLKKLYSELSDHKADPILSGIAAPYKISNDENLDTIKTILEMSEGGLSAEEKSDIIVVALNSAKASVNNYPAPFEEPPIVDFGILEKYFSGSASAEETAQVEKVGNYLEEFNKFASYGKGDTEKIAAICAVEVLKGGEKEKISHKLMSECEIFKSKSKEICAIDHKRDGIDFVTERGRVNLKGADINLEKIEEVTGRRLTGEQMEYLLTTQHQGIVGATSTSVVSEALQKSPEYAENLPPIIGKSSPFCEVDLTDPARVTLRSEMQYNLRLINMETGDETIRNAATAELLTDITDLKSSSFTPGFSSSPISPVMKYAVHDEKLYSITPSASATLLDTNDLEYQRMLAKSRINNGKLLTQQELKNLHNAVATSSKSSTLELFGEEISDFAISSEVAITKEEIGIDEMSIRAIIQKNIGFDNTEDLESRVSRISEDLKSKDIEEESRLTKTTSAKTPLTPESIRETLSKVRSAAASFAFRSSSPTKDKSRKTR